MKYMNFKTLTLMLSASTVLALTGCGSEGTPSDSKLVGSTVVAPPGKIAPVAVVTADPSTATIGDIVIADGSDSSDEDGEIVSYVWKFQDLILGEGVTVEAPTADLAAGTYTITLVVTDNDGLTGTDTVEVTLEEPVAVPTCLETAGIATITLANGQIWIDRNLGASKVADGIHDTEAFGDLYQWGRATDGHEKRISPTTVDLADSIEPGDNLFIISDSKSEIRMEDWVKAEVDDYGTKRHTGWKAITSSTQVCPCGYIVPSVKDYEILLESDRDTLGLTYGGLRATLRGDITNVDQNGNYWTRDSYTSGITPNEETSPIDSLRYVIRMDMDENYSEYEYAFIGSQNRATGASIRCINPSTSNFD